MPPRWRVLVFVGALLLCPVTALVVARVTRHQEPASRAAAFDGRAVDLAVWDEMQRQRLVGVAVGVVRDRQIVHVRGYGFADRDACKPVTSETIFRLASVSKPITAIAAMQLAERGKLDLDSDVRDLVPEYPDQGEPITLRMLLTHQSGIPHDIEPTREQWRRWYREIDPDPAEDVMSALPVFSDKPLVYPPGRRYHYSTPGFILLSAAVQRAGNQPFLDQVQDRIARPLGMRSLQPDHSWKRNENRAAGYRMVNDTIRRVRALDVSWKLGGGGFCCNVDDMTRLVEGILNYRLLPESTFREMWKTEIDRQGKDTHYGLGFNAETDHRDGLRVWHQGAQAKTRTRITLYPDTGLGIVVLSNCEYADTGALTQAVENAVRQMSITAN